ncbi:unnamed protein product, partial [Tenebrio molitor]
CELAETDNESDNNGDEQDITNVLTSNNFKKLKTSNRAVSKDVFTAANPSYSPPSPDEGAFSQGTIESTDALLQYLPKSFDYK